MSETDATGAGVDRLGSPSVSGVNIADHLRKLVRALPIALAAALLVGGAVWFVRDSGERTYEASLTAQISQQSIGAVFNELTQPYIVLITEDRVLSDVVKNGLAPSVDDLRPRVSAMTGSSSSLLIIKAQADSPELAARLALAVQQSLDRAASQMRTEAIARSAADLEEHRRAVEDTFTERLADDPLRPELSFDARDVAREIEFRQVLGMARLTVIGSPRAELVAPHPVQEGLFAALATLIIVAEAVVLARGALARRPKRTTDGAQPDSPAGSDLVPLPVAAAPTPSPAPVSTDQAVRRAPGDWAASPTATPSAAVPPATAPAVPTAEGVDPPPPSVPRAGPARRSPNHPEPKAPGPYEPETTILPRQWPVRTDQGPPSSGTRNG